MLPPLFQAIKRLVPTPQIDGEWRRNGAKWR
jgi:hypothetical protein